MTPADVARLLAKVQAYDNRTVGKANVAAWHEQMAEVQFADGLEAVRRHFATSDDFLMPVHVLGHVDVIQRERHRAEREEAEALHRALPGPVTTDRSAQIRAWLRGTLPKGRPDKLRGERWLAEHPEEAGARFRDGTP